jgi:hypothetical protein
MLPLGEVMLRITLEIIEHVALYIKNNAHG